MLDYKYLNNTFLFSEKKIKDSKIFDEEIKLTKSYLYINNQTNVNIVKMHEYTVILVGYILDIRDEKLTADDILKQIIKECIVGEEEFYDILNYLNGRYMLCISDKNDTKIFSDATALSPMFYYKNYLIASHEIILKYLLEQEYGIILRQLKYDMNSFLDYNNTEEIYSFNPNLFFSFDNLQFERFFPREKYKLKSLLEVIEKTEQYYLPQMRWLDKNYKNIYLSLTGGFDSKLTLALAKPIINNIHCFTYMYKFNELDEYTSLNKYKKVYYKDKVIVDNLVYNFNLNHSYFYFDDYKVPSEYLKQMAKHTSSHHSYKLSYILLKNFKRGGVHLKSTIYELAKLPYHSFADMRVDDEWMIRILKNWAPAEIKKDNKVLFKLYNDYKERNLLNEIIDLNYNLPLMIYWEYRLGNWHGNLTQESDFIIDTFILMNNRYMLNQIISLSLNDRDKKSYLTEMIKRKWPALNYFVANSFDTLE